MSWVPELNGYVKFLRGVPEAWNDLLLRNAANPDTLYFISEDNSDRGKLYLGTKLISDGSIIQISTLNQLNDVLIGNNISPNSLLAYNTTTQKWEPATPSEILATIVGPMVGATSEQDGQGGIVPAPMRGEQYLYLQGNGTWSDPTTKVRADLTSLIGNDSNKTIREIAASEVAKIVANAPSSFDTLEEIASWISTHDEAIDIVQITQDVTDLNNAVFGPNGNDGLVTDVNTINTTLYDTNNGLVTIVNNLSYSNGNLINRVTVLETDMADVQDQLEDIDEKLRWQDLVYTED